MSPEQESQLIDALIKIGNQEMAIAERRLALMERLADLVAQRVDNHAPQLNDRERSVLDVIGDGTMKGEQIAKLVDLEYSGSFKETLAAMVRHGLLINHGRGYSRGPKAP